MHGLFDRDLSKILSYEDPCLPLEIQEFQPLQLGESKPVLHWCLSFNYYIIMFPIYIQLKGSV